MNINTKAIIASTLLTVLFAGNSAIAGDNSYLFEDASYASITESVVAQKVSLQTPAVEVEANR
ncbi:MAG: hypothetical protein V7749_17740 [Cocleimonas sp.]